MVKILVLCYETGWSGDVAVVTLERDVPLPTVTKFSSKMQKVILEISWFFYGLFSWAK